MEKAVTFQSGRLTLEGLLGLGTRSRGAVVTHPHPLYGGDMHNSVVAAIVGAYRGCGYSTLRFNFRGVGRSQGHYANGDGEQSDVGAALTYLARQAIEPCDLAGYSFGAWINTRMETPGGLLRNRILVSPPVDLLDFDPKTALPDLRLVITGEMDPLASPPAIRKLLLVWNPAARLEIVPGADHFYSGCIDRLEEILGSYLVRATDRDA